MNQDFQFTWRKKYCRKNVFLCNIALSFYHNIARQNRSSDEGLKKTKLNLEIYAYTGIDQCRHNFGSNTACKAPKNILWTSVFQPFFDSRHPSGPKKIGGTSAELKNDNLLHRM
jgi:hypothetical protein